MAKDFLGKDQRKGKDDDKKDDKPIKGIFNLKNLVS
jgi:hypothetical protein